jgi:hypothetical protein
VCVCVYVSVFTIRDWNGRDILGHTHSTHTYTHSLTHKHTHTHTHTHTLCHVQAQRVYVGNLSWNVDREQLRTHMADAGEVTYAEVLTEPSGRSKGCGIVGE